MTTPAVTIQDAIDFCADNIAELVFDGVVDVSARASAWIAAMFEDAGAFPPSDNPNAGQRRVIDWYPTNLVAVDEIEAAGAGGCGLLGSAALINAVTRTLCAVRDARLAGAITVAQQTATIAAFNAQWT